MLPKVGPFQLGFLLMVLSACETTSSEEDANETNSFDTNSETSDSTDDPGDEVQDDASEDSGSTDQEDPEDMIVRLDGQMDAEYTYAGSLGEFTDVCDGDAFIIINPDGQLEGEGTCANDFISFGFAIEGDQEGENLAGILVGESAAGRAETPFSGPFNGSSSELTFDHTHAADGESLRLVGTMNLVFDG